MQLSLAALAAAAALAQAAPAAQPADPAPAAASAPAPAVATPQPKKLARQGMICRNEPVLGSKLPRRVCTTPEEEARRKQNDRELTEYIQHSTRVCTTVPCQ